MDLRYHFQTLIAEFMMMSSTRLCRFKCNFSD